MLGLAIACIAVAGLSAGGAIAFAWAVTQRHHAQLADAMRLLASRDYSTFAAGRVVEHRADGEIELTDEDKDRLAAQQRAADALNDPYSQG